MSKEPRDERRAFAALYLAWVTALVAALGALFVGEVAGQAPCVLCWYQRIAMFPLALLLGVASFRGDRGIWRYGLPLAVAGWLVAAFHVALYYGLIPPSLEACGAGPSCTDAAMEFAGLPLPTLSLLAFSIVVIALSPVTARRRR